MDPRTAYLHCHELQYGDFCSVQGLLEAIKIPPDQISNDNLISILWNKVPIKLQKEVGEIKDWSLQELLYCLLRAEARVAECECCNPQFGPKRRLYSKHKVDSSTVKKVGSKEKTQADSSKKKFEYKANIDAEMRIKNLKCYKCQKKGHIAESRMISLEDGTCLPSEKSTDTIS